MRYQLLNYKNVMWVLCLLLGSIACRKDLGNYTFHDINTGEIQGIEDEYELELGASPVIKPVLAFSLDSKDDNFTYEWTCFDRRLAPGSAKKIIHTGKNLDITLNLGLGTYSMYYSVKEKATGISWIKNFSLTITGSIKKKGWFVLTENGEKANLDYFQEDLTAIGTYPVIYRNFTSRITDAITGTPIRLEGKPRYVTCMSNTVSGITGGKAWVYLGTAQSAEKINVTDGYIWRDKIYAFKNETATGTYPEIPEWIRPVSSGTAYAFVDGSLFKSSYNQRVWYGVPVNRLATGETFRVSPVVAISRDINMFSILFDEDHKRFVKHGGGTVNYCTLLPANPDGFDPNNLNKNLVWMGFTSAYGGQAVALLKDAAGKIFLARMQFASGGAFSALTMEVLNITDIQLADHFALDQQYGYLVYSVGSKLYRYNMDAKDNALIKDYGNAKVSLLKTSTNPGVPSWSSVEQYPQYYDKVLLEPVVFGLSVGVYDPAAPATSGKVEVIKVPGIGGMASVYYTLSGFGKVVDTEYSY